MPDRPAPTRHPARRLRAFRGLLVTATVTSLLLSPFDASASASAAASIERIVATATPVGSARFDTTIAFPGANVVHEHGTYDFAHHLGLVTGEANPPGSVPNTREVIDGGSVYATLSPSEAALFHPVKTWLVDHLPVLTGEPAAVTSLFDIASIPPIPDAKALLAGLAPDIESTERIGTATIDGTATTEYTVVLKPTKVAGAAGPKVVTEANAAKAFGPSHPMRLWLNAQHHIRQLELALPFGGNRPATETVDYTDYDVPVHVTTPPPDETVTLEQLQTAMCHGASTSTTGSGSYKCLFRG